MLIQFPDYAIVFVLFPQFEQESMTMKDDLSSVEEELEASRVVVSFLQKEIDQLQRQLNTR